MFFHSTLTNFAVTPAWTGKRGIRVRQWARM